MPKIGGVDSPAREKFNALLDNSGNVVVRYVYDAWGNHAVLNSDGTDCESGIGVLNPFRYRGYFYDVETGLYYLQTRYYDPETGRFITIDGIEYLDPETINGLNLYAYCGNNPVMYTDPTGTFISFLIGLLIAVGIGAAVGAVSYTVSEVVSYAVAGEWTWSWGMFFGSIIGGAVAGALTFVAPAVSPFITGAISGAISTSTGMIIENAMGDANYTAREIIVATFLSAFISSLTAGISSKIKIKGFSAGRGSLSQIYKQIFTKFRNETIKKIKVKTFGKMFLYAAGMEVFSTIVNSIQDLIR